MNSLEQVGQYVAGFKAGIDRWDAKADAAILKIEGARLRRELAELTTPPTATADEGTR